MFQRGPGGATASSTLSPDLLLGNVLSFGSLGRRKLDRVLGGGSTAVVFRGVDPDRPEDETKHVAIKVARPDSDSSKALETEFHNLRHLEPKDQRTHYFPRVLYPNVADGLQVRTMVRDPRQGWVQSSWSILVLELVRASGVHDLRLRFPELCLPEPLALAIAAQYAEMLKILHSADLSCADRKLSDLRWSEAYPLSPDTADGIRRWRAGEPVGHLLVLDWNVTDRADAEAVALDLFRFGLLWYQMLLGDEARFRKGRAGEAWQLEAPLNRHPRWSALSAGTGRILARLLHPNRERRYADAEELSRDLAEQLARWQKAPEVLWEEMCWEALALDKRWESADTLRVLVERWGARDSADFRKLYDGLKYQRYEASYRNLYEHISLSRWRQAKEELDRLAENEADPSRLLFLDRQRAIADAALESKALSQSLGDLLEYAKNLDSTDVEIIALAGRLQKEWQSPPWDKVVARLTAEGGYHLRIARARELKERDLPLEALHEYESLMALRQNLKDEGDVLLWLDEIYGDPSPEWSELQERTRVEDLLNAALQAIANGAELDAPRQRLGTALRLAPGDKRAQWAYRLLEAERAWRAACGSSLALQVLLLDRWKRLWEEKEGNWVSADTIARLNEELERRREELRLGILELLQTAIARLQDLSISAPEPLDSIAGFTLLYHTYCEKFGDDAAILKGAQDALEEYKSRIRQLLDATPRALNEWAKYRDNLARGIYWAEYGEKLAKSLHKPWPDDLSAEKIKGQRAQVERLLTETHYWIARYRHAP